MKFQKYTDVHEFYKVTYKELMNHEAQNMILLGNMMIGIKGKDKTDWRDPTKWVMATVSDTKGIQLTALMTPPHNLTLYATENTINLEAISCLIDGLSEYEIPGVMTEKNLAELFAKAYATRQGVTSKITMSQRIYQLTAVNPAIKQFGDVRLFEEKDMYFFPYWFEALIEADHYGSTKMSIPKNLEEYHYRISSKKLYVLEVDGEPVSMGGFSRKLETAIGIGYIYTPPYYRCKGYASSCVAKLSQLALDKGFSKCVLYTDLLNPTSNSIYQKIGYNAVCDSLMIKFE